MTSKPSDFSCAICYTSAANFQIIVKMVSRKRFVCTITATERCSDELKLAVEVACKSRGLWMFKHRMIEPEEFYELGLKGRSLTKAMAEVKAILKALNWRITYTDYHFASGVIFQDQSKEQVDLVGWNTDLTTPAAMQLKLQDSPLVSESAICGIDCVKLILTPKAYHRLGESLQTLAKRCS